MSIQHLKLGLVLVCLTILQSTSFGQTSRAALTLTEVLRVTRGNFDVQLATQNLAGAQSDVLAADHAPAPVLTSKIGSVDLQNGVGGGNFFRSKRIDKSVGLDWTWERGGKRGWRVDAAKLATAAAQADLDEALTQQQIAASMAFYELAAAQERLQRVQEMEQGALALAKAAKRRVQAGDLAAQDALRADIESKRAEGETMSAQLDFRRAALVLQQVMALKPIRPSEDTEGNLRVEADWPHIGGPLAPVRALDEGQLVSVLDQRPDVRAAQERVRAAQAAVSGTLALKKADVTWGVSFDHIPGTSTRLVELRMQIPLQAERLGGYDYQGEERKALSQLAQAETVLEKTRSAAMADLLRLHAERSVAAQRLDNYVLAILPPAKQVLANAELAYSKGAMSLTDLIEARRTLRSTQLEALAAKADFAKSLAIWHLRADVAKP
jgi:outer membrane protein, heavy metal efflux system